MRPRPAQLLAALAAALVLAACGRPDREPADSGGARAMGEGAALEGLGDLPPPPELAEVPATAPMVVFLGDSIGAGLHLPAHLAFPSVLRLRLARENRPFRLVSSCESGRTTAGGVTALDWVLRAGADLVVLELGGNDGLRGVALEQVEANLRKIVARARAAGARVLLLGVRLPPNYGEYGRDFDALYPRLARELELAFVPYFMRGVGGVPELNLPDGLHPTAEGHEKLADNVLPTFSAVLAEIVARDGR